MDKAELRVEVAKQVDKAEQSYLRARLHLDDCERHLQEVLKLQARIEEA